MEWLSVVLGPLSMAAGVLLLLIVLAVFIWLTGKIEGYDPINEIVLRDNAALGVRYALYVFAVVFALLGIFDRSQGDSGILEFSSHAILAALLIHLSRYLNDWLILYDFSNNREVVQEKNIAVALVEGATYVASAYVIAGAFYDWESGLWLAVVWFVIGQFLLVALGVLYRVFARGRGAQRPQRRRRRLSGKLSAVRRDCVWSSDQRTVKRLATGHRGGRSLHIALARFNRRGAFSHRAGGLPLFPLERRGHAPG